MGAASPEGGAALIFLFGPARAATPTMIRLPDQAQGPAHLGAYRGALQGVLLAVLVWLAYGNALHGPFVFDDFHVVPNNPAVRGPADIPSFFADPTTFSILPGNRDWRPIFLTSMALSWWVGGGSTLPFHVVSVTLHMGNVLLLYLILGRLLSRTRDPRGSLAASEGGWALLLPPAIFAVHPLATESVSYISAQSVLLAGFFCLLAFYLFLRVNGSEQPLSPPRRRVAGVGSCVVYALALMSKPIAITLPLVLLLWDFIIGTPPANGKADRFPDRIHAPERIAARLLKHLPYALISLAYLGLRTRLLPKPFAIPGAVRATWDHYLTQTDAIVSYYLKGAIIPAGLNIDPTFPISTSLLDARVLFSIAILTVIVFLLIRFRRQRALVFWSIWFPVCLLVTTYLVTLRQVVNEHRVYLSLVGFCVVAGLLFVNLRRALAESMGPRSGRIVATVLVLLLVPALGSLTRERNRDWASKGRLWEDAALRGGTWRAQMNYGIALRSKGLYREAFAQFEKAHKMADIAYTNINLGLAYLQRGESERGLAYLEKAVRKRPTLPEAHLYLAHGLETVGRIDEAEGALNRALDLRPNYLKGIRKMAEFRERQDDPGEAISWYRRLLEVDPGQTGVKKRIRRLEGTLEGRR